jgi:hypothetical protein
MRLLRSGDFQERVCSLADEYLETSLGYSAQALTQLSLICETVRYFSYHTVVQLITPRQASKEFPILLKFDGNWVVHDYLRVYLKNTAQKAKKEQQQKERELVAAAKGKAKGVFIQTSGGSNLIMCLSSQMTVCVAPL